MVTKLQLIWGNEMLMNDEDYSILGIHVDNSKELVVVSHFLSHCKEWPATLIYKNKKYSYDGITALPRDYVGHYFSMALYQEINHE